MTDERADRSNRPSDRSEPHPMRQLWDSLGTFQDDPIELPWRYATPLYLLFAALSLVLYFGIKVLLPNDVHLNIDMLGAPLGFSWTDFMSAVLHAWPVYVLALIIGVAVRLRHPRFDTEPDPVMRRSRRWQFWRGVYVAGLYGTVEEFIFRGMLLLSVSPVLLWLDRLLDGGLSDLTTTFVVPAANWVLHYSPLMISNGWQYHFVSNPSGWAWAVILTIVMTSFQFRQWGPRGWWNPLWMVASLLLGLYMSYLVLHYGILVAIVVHVLYDIIRMTVAIRKTGSKAASASKGGHRRRRRRTDDIADTYWRESDN